MSPLKMNQEAKKSLLSSHLAETASHGTVRGGMNFEGSHESTVSEAEIRAKQVLAMRGKEDKLLSKQILQRREWMEKYKVSERIIFDLFSEFTAMMIIQDKDNMLEQEVSKGNCQYEKELTRLFPSGKKSK